MLNAQFSMLNGRRRGFRLASFEFVSDFGLRASNLPGGPWAELLDYFSLDVFYQDIACWDRDKWPDFGCFRWIVLIEYV